MSIEQGGTNLTEFEFEDERLPVEFQRTVTGEIPRVEWDVYKFVGDETHDLAIIRIEEGANTPKQRMIEGKRTVEGHISGLGHLVIERENGVVEVYQYGLESPEKHPFVNVLRGDIMQWVASTPLTVWEVCYPPYKDGRFEDLT